MNSLARPFEDLVITVVSDGPFFVDELFQRKFSGKAPHYGYSVICFYRKNFHHFLPLCYTNFLLHDEVILVGGAMTDGDTFRQMPEELAGRIGRSGGIYLHLLRFAFDYFKDECEAFFGHAGDQRAYDVDIQAGFEPTPYEHLIVNFHKPISDDRKQFLIEKIHRIGAF
jgi:hypothetical protein